MSISRKDFMERMLDMAQHAFLPEKIVRESPPCGKYSLEDFDLYMRERMPAVEAERFEEHCLGCLGCAVQLLLAQDRLNQEKEQAENEILMKRTMSLVDSILKKKEGVREPSWLANRINIILEYVHDAWRLVSTTGETLTLAPGVAYGGIGKMKSTEFDSPVKSYKDKMEDASGEPKEPLSTLQISQEFTLPDIFVQVSISSEETGRLMMTFAFFDKAAGRGVQGIELHLTHGSEPVRKATSGERGRASFIIRVPADYEIEILQDGERIGAISFKAETKGKQ